MDQKYELTWQSPSRHIKTTLSAENNKLWTGHKVETTVEPG